MPSLARAACCSIRRRCPDASASAISARARSSSSICSLLPVSDSGRCCRSVRPATAILPTSRFSAFAGNPLLISLEDLISSGACSNDSDLHDAPRFVAGRVDLRERDRAPASALASSPRSVRCRWTSRPYEPFDRFCSRHAAWLDDFALFMAVKDAHDHVAWTKWEAGHRRAAARSGRAVVTQPARGRSDCTS